MERGGREKNYKDYIQISHPKVASYMYIQIIFKQNFNLTEL